ncbi:DMT family transporter [Brevibacillus dissolubilis]|uniref:DMT family transporter n=1 Tax=Brevibacillus dissolubilis TaxID=1844116 RepID=UPI001115C94A|nr:DMT family transporter [Brevibacillus dissolubilis]
MSAEKFFTHPAGVLLAACGATFLWGSSFPFIKSSYQELEIGKQELFEQMLFAGYRFVLAGILILLICLFIGKSIRYQQGTLPRLAKVGLFQTFLQYIFFYIGMSYSTGIQGSIIAGTTSFFQILLAHFMFSQDTINLRKVIGMIVGFLGVIVVNLPKGSLQLTLGIADVLLLIAMFCGGLGNILAKKESAHMDILYMTAYQMLLGGIGLVAVGASKVGLFPFEFSIKAWLMLLYLAFVSAGGFVLWNNVMKYNKVGGVSMYMFLIPVFGVLLSALILGEAVHLSVLLAVVLVAAGIIIVNREGKAKPGSGGRTEDEVKTA